MRRSALPDTAARYGVVFDQWVTRRDPNHAILVVRRDGKTVFAKVHGADPLKPAMIASLSKAITGACVATLIRDGKLVLHDAAARCAVAVLQAIRRAGRCAARPA